MNCCVKAWSRFSMWCKSNTTGRCIGMFWVLLGCSVAMGDEDAVIYRCYRRQPSFGFSNSRRRSSLGTTLRGTRIEFSSADACVRFQGVTLIERSCFWFESDKATPSKVVPRPGKFSVGGGQKSVVAENRCRHMWPPSPIPNAVHPSHLWNRKIVEEKKWRAREWCAPSICRKFWLSCKWMIGAQKMGHSCTKNEVEGIL